MGDSDDGLAATLTAARQRTLEDPSAPTPTNVGALRYQLGEEIGRGAMGRVLAARDSQFGREVAIKTLHHDVADPGMLDRFTSECLITGNLEHPGIPAVYERGKRDGTPFYAMRRVRGQTLEEALADADTIERRLPLIPQLIRVAHTLAYAHSEGVVHRDVKPSNIVVGLYGETFVLDWGIAKVRGVATDSALATARRSSDESTATRAGSVVGTPAYMSPEQASGRLDAVDERTDVFALGALLYHVLTGHPPYRRGTATEVIDRAKRCDFEPVDQAAVGAPRALRAICTRAMSEQPDRRFLSAGEFASALEQFTADAVAHQDRGAVGWVARFATGASLLLIALGTLSVISIIPTIGDQGFGVFLSLFLTVLGFSLSGIEYATRSQHRLGPLILALAGVTLVNGFITVTAGLSQVFASMHAPEVFSNVELWREYLTVGSREAISSFTTSGALAAAQLLAWAIARRRALLS